MIELQNTEFQYLLSPTRCFIYLPFYDGYGLVENTFYGLDTEKVYHNIHDITYKEHHQIYNVELYGSKAVKMLTPVTDDKYLSLMYTRLTAIAVNDVDGYVSFIKNNPSFNLENIDNFHNITLLIAKLDIKSSVTDDIVFKIILKWNIELPYWIKYFPEDTLVGISARISTYYKSVTNINESLLIYNVITAYSYSNLSIHCATYCMNCIIFDKLNVNTLLLLKNAGLASYPQLYKSTKQIFLASCSDEALIYEWTRLFRDRDSFNQLSFSEKLKFFFNR